MARIFIDGFESGGDDLWDAESNATVISSAGLDMDGDYCLDLNDLAEYIQKDITADDEMYFAFLYRPTDVTGSEAIMGVFNGGTLLIGFGRPAAAGGIQAYRGLYTSIVTGTKTFNINTTYLIEIRIKIADSGGRIELKVDGVADIDFTGDTKVDANTQFDKVRLGYWDLIGMYCKAYFDNMIMDDTAWIGDTKIQKILPTGAGATTGWTPSAGANYACVDERPASDADYVSINSNDAVDTYAAGDMAGSISSVKCVQVQSRTESDGSPTPTNLKLVVRSGGADHLSGDKTVPAGPKSLFNLWETNPADSQAWEEADVNAVEIGIKSAA
jgi:hypothetical protein